MWFRRNSDAEGTATADAPAPGPDGAAEQAEKPDISALTRPPATPKPAPARLVPDAATTETLKPKVVDVLATVFDPEIPVNIYELGLIYDILADADRTVEIRMTLTAPGCPAAQSLPVEVDQKVRAIPEVKDVRVEIVWDPPWTKDHMSEAAKLQLGIF